MELIIFKNIIYGDLKPWSSTAVNNKFYRDNLSKEFIRPTKNIDNYYTALKKLLPDKQNLYYDDGLEVYLAQKDTDKQYNILYPLVELKPEEPKTSTQKFYHYLLKNETTRLSNRILECINKEISDLQRKEIVQNTVKACKDLLLRIGTDQNEFPKTELTEYVIPNLIINVIRLLKETELLYPGYLHDLPSDKLTIFGELLQIDIPDYKIDKTTHIFTEVKNILLGNDNYSIGKDERFSFGFIGNKNNLRAVLLSLTREIEMLNDSTSIEDLFSVLTSKDLKLGAKQIHINCETTQFSYIVSKLSQHFTNFTPTTIETSKLFYSKKGNLLKRNNLYKNKSNFTKENDTINSIFKQL